MNSDVSEGEEAYLKRALEAFEDNPSEIVKTSDLAARLNVSSASVTEMIKKLAARDLVTHIPYRGSRLTSKGFIHASRVKRRQMLIEILLSDVLGLEGDLSELASKMESALERSHELALDKMLGYPEESSDGRKIPSFEREFDESTTIIPMSEMSEGQNGIVKAIKMSNDDSKIMLKIDVVAGTMVGRSEYGFTVDDTEYRVNESILDSIFVEMDVR
jgi:DtxR family Mn-dependent transcriptional regulator